MKITQIFAEHEVTISFEVFPPKTDDRYATVEKAACEIAALHPSFMSVTYGAGGGTSKNTASIAADIQDKFHTPVLAHLTCVSSTREHVRNMVSIYKEKGIENIMALRGDIPKEGRSIFEYNHACELIHDIKSIDDSFCIGGACYPEGHVECESPSADIRYLKEKVDAGLDFLTTQMFFDNNMLYNFLYRIREAGIDVPVLPGIMPITNRKQVARSVALSGSTVPQRFRMMVDRFGDDPAKMKQAGVIYATEQIIDLISNGVTHIHVYSMNKPDIAAGIMQSLDAIWDHSFTQKNKF
ncbi:MAG: methylenetetrahydrofolate reductase [NAD(P)H] [Lachnospiraceae bacterium]|nr:methylenetetrahydrofolate reductase [NAD(P)H] [Bacillota bacterium]MDD7252421.1 methylenetetrahydrofolate reductase [NAD(P)H] [Bacillota bacterium]MDY2948947.1 methylenetetrahydrofolate reductase [NAD(P)H] [Lachnospiraceae bacterium]